MTAKKNLKKIIPIAVILTMLFTLVSPPEVSAASRPAKVKSLKVASQSYNSLKISWKRVKKAKGYQIYRATKKNGKYKKVKTIKKAKTVSWINKKLTTGKRYYYKVRAIRGSRKGSFSAKKSGVPKLSKTGGVKASAASSSAIKVSWNKTAGAEGYQIYRATSKSGTYSKVKTTGSTSFTNTGLVASKTYYYKVRSYRKVGKATKYSNYSSVVYAKTKAKAAVIIPTKPTKPAEPTTPTNPVEPNEPEETNTLKVIDQETGKEVTELQAGKTYDVESSSTVYIGLDRNTVGTAASSNKAAQICHYARRELQPVSRGIFWLKNNDGVRSYEIIKGTTIHTGGLNLELGGPVPAGYTESYDTIYGYTQYVYNKDKENLVLVGAEDGAVKTVFTMDGTYSMNTDEEYLKTDETSFGAVTIQPIRYYEYRMPDETILDGKELDSLGHEANLVASAVRVKDGLKPLKENQILREQTAKGARMVYDYYGGTSIDGKVHSVTGEELYTDRLFPANYSFESENATGGGYGAISLGVAAVDAYYNSAGHKAWLLREATTDVGTGFIYNGNNYAVAIQAYAQADNGPNS